MPEANPAASILTSTKKILGIDESYTVFDLDVITHINSAFTVLQDLGIGPAQGFMIEDKEQTWNEFVEEERFNSVRTLVYMMVRLAFDPPQSGFAVTALEKQIEEHQVRLSMRREATDYTDPEPRGSYYGTV